MRCPNCDQPVELPRRKWCSNQCKTNWHNRDRYANDEKARDEKRRSYLRIHYGITPEDFDALMIFQDGVCAICGKPPTDRRLDIDHDHKTKLVRGLLCPFCNRRLIGRHRDAARFRKAADYLEHPPWQQIRERGD